MPCTTLMKSILWPKALGIPYFPLSPHFHIRAAVLSLSPQRGPQKVKLLGQCDQANDLYIILTENISTVL